MSGTHKAAICRAASAAAGREIQKQVDAGVTSDVQIQAVIDAHEEHIHKLTVIAASIASDGDED